jgi:transglutaminase-like putative cysteine protease
MITADDLESRLAEAGHDGPDGTDARADEIAAAPGPRAVAETPIKEGLVVGAAALASLAAAVLATSLFRGSAPKAIALAGVALGAGLSWLATRLERGAALQYLVLPIAAVVGAILVAPAATGGTANLPGLVSDALRSGGLLQPPVAFEPGWRFLLVVLFAVMTSTAIGVSLTLRRPRLAVAVPLPVLVAAALLQPKGHELGPSLVAGVLAIGGLALAYGADLPTGEGTAARFESRRLLRGGALLLALVVAVIGISRAGFLFPTPDRQPVVPPRRPPIPPPEPDRELFATSTEAPGPFRVGVLDGYDGRALLLPPIDPARLRDVPPTGALPGIAPPPPPAPGAAPVRITFRISDLRGGTVPVVPGATVVRAPKKVQYDPRTEVVRLPSGRPPKDFRYDVEALPSPDGRALTATGPPPAALVKDFAAVPPPPNEVVTLLATAPTATFDRLQYVRQALYTHVVAAGAGRPVDVTPARVAEMLHDGTEASPFEISTAEVLLARWAGVPARLGFGFYGGEPVPGGGRSFHPKHGAAWLEAYFTDYGWIPLVGTPPRAKASLGNEDKNDNPFVSATKDLALVVYVPVRRQNIELLYQRVRAWAAIALPSLALLLAVATSWPLAAKVVRRRRRERWAREHGPTGRIWAAYCELRDRAHDLNIRDPFVPPLEFVGAVAPDEEHEELAWLVTRAVWGDLRRDITDADAQAAEEMARSVARRLAGAQTAINRVAASFARASLRHPFSAELPGVVIGDDESSRRGRVLRAGVIAVAAIVVIAPLAIPRRPPPSTELAVAIPESVVPDRLMGRSIERETALEDSYAKPLGDSLALGGQVYTVRRGTVVEGSFQVALLRPEIDLSKAPLQREVESTLQSGAFRTRHFGPVRIRELALPEQHVYVWFPPTHNVVEIFVLRADVDDADALVRAVIGRQLQLPDDVAPEGVSR